MRGKAIWTRHPRVVETEIGSDISLYDPANERVTVLNATASDIWRLVDGETTLSEVTEVLARAYNIDADVIADDVAATLERLAEQSLVERRA